MAEQKRLTRNTADRVIGGVAGGVARYFEIDPVFVRLAFVVLALLNGMGALIYLIMWLVVPGDGPNGLSGEDTVRANIEDMKQQVRQWGGSLRGNGQAPVIIGVLLVGLGALFLLREFVPGIPEGLLWPALLIGIGAYLIARRSK